MRNDKLDWIRTGITIAAFLVTGGGMLWAASAQVTRLESRVENIEAKHAEIMAAFAGWRVDHQSTDREGWIRNEQAHKEIMAEVRSNAQTLQEVAKKQAVVLDRLKITPPN